MRNKVIFVFLCILIKCNPLWSTEEPLYEKQTSQQNKMKVVTLNIWGGSVREPLIEFIRSHEDVDVFCLQEVYYKAPHRISKDDSPVSLDIFTDINNILPSHKGYFRPVVNGIYGIGMLVKKAITVIEEGEHSIHENPYYEGRGPTHSRILQWLKYRVNNKVHTIVNVHGLWNGNGKSDSAERIEQSRRIRDFMDSIHTPIVLCGDFNLRPDTESIAILEPQMINLIKRYNYVSTRTNLYTKEERYADYMFISNEIELINFKVLEDVVSDHKPLLLEYHIF